MNRADDAVRLFLQGFNCAQAVLAAFASDFGLEREVALRLTSAFGSGVARSGGPCGAMTGALLVIGLKHGKSAAEDEDAKELTYRLAARFREDFANRHGSLTCRELLGYDLSTTEGMQFVKQHKLVTTICPHFVRDAVTIAEKVLEL